MKLADAYAERKLSLIDVAHTITFQRFLEVQSVVVSEAAEGRHGVGIPLDLSRSICCLDTNDGNA